MEARAAESQQPDKEMERTPSNGEDAETLEWRYCSPSGSWYAGDESFGPEEPPYRR